MFTLKTTVPTVTVALLMGALGSGCAMKTPSAPAMTGAPAAAAPASATGAKTYSLMGFGCGCDISRVSRARDFVLDNISANRHNNGSIGRVSGANRYISNGRRGNGSVGRHDNGSVGNRNNSNGRHNNGSRGSRGGCNSCEGDHHHW